MLVVVAVAHLQEWQELHLEEVVRVRLVRLVAQVELQTQVAVEAVVELAGQQVRLVALAALA
jgi:hypothetical protein